MKKDQKMSSMCTENDPYWIDKQEKELKIKLSEHSKKLLKEIAVRNDISMEKALEDCIYFLHDYYFIQ